MAHAEEDGQGGLCAYRWAPVAPAGQKRGQRAGLGGGCDDLVHALRVLELVERAGIYNQSEGGGGAGGH